MTASGGKQVELRDLFLDTRAGWGYPLVGGSRVQFLTFDADALDVDRRQDRVVVGTTRVRLTPDGADVLNETFGGSFESGQDFGELTLRVRPRAAEEGRTAEERAKDAVDEALAELRELEQRTRRLVDEAADELSREDRRRLEEAGRALEDALGG